MLEAFGLEKPSGEPDENEGGVDVSRMKSFGIVDTGTAGADVPKLVQVAGHPRIMASF